MTPQRELRNALCKIRKKKFSDVVLMLLFLKLQFEFKENE